MTAEDAIVQALRDPGSYTERQYVPSVLTDGTSPEPQVIWQARAVAIALEREGWLRGKKATAKATAPAEAAPRLGGEPGNVHPD